MDVQELQSADKEAVYSIYHIDQDLTFGLWFSVLSFIFFWKTAPSPAAKEHQLMVVSKVLIDFFSPF